MNTQKYPVSPVVRSCIAGACALLISGLVLVSLWPAVKAEKALGRQVHVMKENINAVRDEIQVLKPLPDIKMTWVPSTTAQALDELARTAQAQGVTVRSFSSGALEPPTESGLSRLPAQMEIEATYGNLERFLDSLSNLKYCRLSAESLSLARDPAILPSIRAKMQMDVFFVVKT